MKRFLSWLWRSFSNPQPIAKDRTPKFEPKRTELRFRWISIAPQLLLDANHQAQ